MLKIIPSTEKYEEFINQLIGKTYSGDIRIPYKNKGITLDKGFIDSVYVALLDEEPVGFYCIWTNNFHPHSLYFNIIVERRYRQRKIGMTLYQHMIALNTNLFYLQSSFYESLSAGSDFLKSLGFKLYRTTKEPKIDTKEMKINLETIQELINKYDLEVSALSDVRSDNEILEIVELSKKCYINSHLDNPVKDIEIGEWKNLMQDELIAEGSYILRKEKRVIAFALMYENDDSSMDLGWRGVVEDYDFIRPRLIELLTNLQIEFVQKSNKRILNTEIDNTDKWSTDILSFLKLEKANKWLSYQQKMKIKNV